MVELTVRADMVVGVFIIFLLDASTTVAVGSGVIVVVVVVRHSERM